MSDCAGSKSSSGESNRSSSSSTITLKQNAEAGARAIMVVAKKKKKRSWDETPQIKIRWGRTDKEIRDSKESDILGNKSSPTHDAKRKYHSG